MREVEQLSLDVLRIPEESVRATRIVPASSETIRARAPNVVTKPETMNYRTLSPEPGGLFDFKVFGPGTVIDAPLVPDDELVKPRKTQFARITLAVPVVHPLFVQRVPNEVAELAGWTREQLDHFWLNEEPERYRELVDALAASPAGRTLVVEEVPVLPPDLRPLKRLDDDRWATSPLNDHYRNVIHRNARVAKLLEQGAAPAVVSSDYDQLGEALARLYDNENYSEPVRDAQQEPLLSLYGLGGGARGLGDGLAALGSRHPIGVEPLPGALHRVAAVMFALGFELSPRS